MVDEGVAPREGRLPAHVEIYDTTLRDGTQMEGLSLSCDDKIRIAKRLGALGVAYVEGGFPGSNPKDAQFFEQARGSSFGSATVVAFGATCRANGAAEEDPALRELVAAGTEIVTIFGKSWNLHVTDVLGTTLDENLRIIRDSVAFLKGSGCRVFYDAEHFFDGFRADSEYALATVAAAAEAGAEVVILCDTNGGSMPWDVAKGVQAAKTAIPSSVAVGIHAHDDGGLAVANSLFAVRAGAAHVQGTINGYGERCGNANLCALIPDLALKLGVPCLAGELSELFEVSHYVAELANLAPRDQQPYVGRSAFAHKGGVHVAAMRRSEASYQHIVPERVGNQCRVVVSELSGRGNLFSKAEEMGVTVAADHAKEALSEIKDAEAAGYSFEAAEASVALVLKRKAAGYRAPFELVDYKVLAGAHGENPAHSEATVKVRVGDTVHFTVDDGNGPVQALDGALRKALRPVFPEIHSVHLTDFTVRILDGRDATASTTRVLIRSSDGQESWTTVGASPNIIEASCRALLDSLEFALLRARGETRVSRSSHPVPAPVAS